MQQQNKYKTGTLVSILPVPGAGKSMAMPLQDNRPKTIALQKQVAAFGNVVQKKANNTGLPDNLKSGVENLGGFAMDDVNVHYNSAKPAQLNAHAYAQGTDIHIAPGQEKHLAHEAWHVVQQKQGRVKPTLQMKTGVPVNDDKGLEDEADIMGRKALQLKKRYNALRGTSFVHSRVSQRVGEEGDGGGHEHAESFIVNDSQPASAKQVHKTDFLNALSSSVTKMADDVLVTIHQTSANCPYIAYWFAHYENQSPAYIEKALARYAPGSTATGNWRECIHAVSARARVAFLNHLANGSLAGVPEGVPKDLIEDKQPSEKPNTVQLMKVAQLCCCGDDRNAGRPPAAQQGEVVMDDMVPVEEGGHRPAARTDTHEERGGAATTVAMPGPLTPVHSRELTALVSAHSIAELQQGAQASSSSSSGGSILSRPATGKRTRRELADGKLFNEAYEVKMKAWLEKVSGLILGGSYREAYNLLTSEGEARSVGVNVRVNYRRGGDPFEIALKNMSYASEHTIDIYVPADESWLEDAGVAKKVLPMHLEEYMHQYQARRNKFLSPRTERFKSEVGLPDMAEHGKSIGDTEGRVDYDEIDVMAQLHDWGFDEKEIEYVDRYKERAAFWAWFQKQSH